MIDFSGNIKIEDRYGTWYEIDRAKASDGNEYILFESEQYGDEADCVLCILPDDSQVKHVIGKKSGKEYIQIPKEFEVEQTADNIIDALEQDLGLTIIDEALTLDLNAEGPRKVNLKESLSVGDEERNIILNFFNKQKSLWDNYPDVLDERFEGDSYIVELDNSNPTYIADTKESLKDLCEKISLDFYWEERQNDNGFYGRTYEFYYLEGEEDPTNEELEITEDLNPKFTLGFNEGYYTGDYGDDESYESFFLTDDIYITFYGYGDKEVDIEWEYDTWDDPGDYPSGAGGGPLASYEYVCGGTFTTEINKDKLQYKLNKITPDGYVGEEINKQTALKLIGCTEEELDSAISECKDMALDKINDHIDDYIQRKVNE